jgi:hypothetical protein
VVELAPDELEMVATVVLVVELADGQRQALVVLQLRDKEITVHERR